LLERLNRSGELYLTHTRLDGRYTLRLCVGQTNTEARHVEAAWRRIREAAAEVLSERSPDLASRWEQEED
jgi:aromatic-L-amino-acid decarboxylase